MPTKPSDVGIETTELPSLAEISPELSVFINCPFDAEYQPLFNALVFTTVCCGFVPRSALESGSAGVPRMERICEALLGSKYSIHDLSRCKGEGSEHLARFNMPLELGLAMAKRFLPGEEHDWVALVPEGHNYVQFVSDLAGYDPLRHDASVESIVPSIMAWLFTRPEAVTTLDPIKVLEALPRFQAAKEQLDMVWSDQPPWPAVIANARLFIPT